MGQRSVRRWLYDVIDGSLQPEPSTYPHRASDGVLNGLSFTQANVEIYPNRIVTELDINSESAIMIDIPTSKQTQKTGQGAYAILVVNHSIELNIFWYANVAGEYDSEGNQISAPTFTNQTESDIVFDKFLKGIEKTISLSVYKYNAPDNIEGASWPVIDSTSDNGLSVINSVQPMITLENYGASRLEDSNNLVYQATVSFDLLETYQAAVKAT